jgi:hypothetical protein
MKDMERYEGILARVYIRYANGGNDIAIFDQFEFLKQLGLGDDDKGYYGESLLNIGSNLQIDDKDYRVININTMFMPQTYPPNNAKGINVYGVGKQLFHNFAIVYEVEDA